ncbi:DUF475 domain-containing protein [Candidatus Saccharibacteria bacterium]|nr:DUF475 domain-containing protein [Candidatus Saccharibacteria bacterium]
MEKYLHVRSPLRIFTVSALVTIGSILWALFDWGLSAMFVVMVLIAVEVAFSFDNAIVNAKVLKQMSKFWQTIFLTVGVAIAVFGMRLVFPIILVTLTAGLSWSEVINLALNNPDEYSHKLEEAHVVLSAFGGGFLLMLALHFFFDGKREVLWYKRLERRLQQFAYWWVPACVALSVIALAAAMPFNHEPRETLVAGILGVLTYSVIHGASEYFSAVQKRKLGNAARVGLAGFISFLYLEVLDASFSFDGVLGAFAVTKDVILIAIGLGVGALWVRSLTVYMVRRGTLDSYKYIEHGAHYTITVLACVLILSIFINVPEVIAGLAGLGIIGSSIIASRQALAAQHDGK